jgi:flagellar basal-body rod protein FlgC
MSISNVFMVAGSALTAQSLRLNVVASNLANVDSATSSNGQPYRAKQVLFQAVPIADGATGVRVARVLEGTAPPRVVYEPRHPLADANGNVTYPNVDPTEELVNMISASRSYQANVEVMQTAKTLMQRVLALGQ